MLSESSVDSCIGDYDEPMLYGAATLFLLVLLAAFAAAAISTSPCCRW